MYSNTGIHYISAFHLVHSAISDSSDDVGINKKKSSTNFRLTLSLTFWKGKYDGLVTR